MLKPTIAAIALAMPAYAETTPQGQVIYTALVVTYADELQGLGSGTVYLSHRACVEAMNKLRQDENHAPASYYGCKEFYVADGVVVSYAPD